MAWQGIRKATSADIEKVEAAAARFLERHGAPVWATSQDTSANGVDAMIEGFSQRDNVDGGAQGRYLRRLWHKCVERATGCNGAQGIAWGNVGYHVD